MSETASAKAKDALSALWLLGAIGSIIGGILLAVGAQDDKTGLTIIGGILAGVASVALSVAIIGTGVRIGSLAAKS